MRKFFGVSAVLACTGLAFGQVWNEVGDAGQAGIGAAQMPVGSGPLLGIIGAVSGANDVDLYGPFVIVNPAIFLADTRAAAAFDTQLFLFDAAGMGVVANDDWNGLQSAISGQAGFGPGQYFLAISSFNADPLDGGGGAIFTTSTFPGPNPQQFMPDPNAGALATWTASGFGSGEYVIRLTGVEFVPGPSALSLLGLGGLIAMRRRRG